MGLETENFIRAQVRKYLLAEGDGLAQATGKEKGIERRRTRGRPPKWISETEGLAASNPTELLKRLGLEGFSPQGKTLLEKAGKLLKKAIQNTRPMEAAFKAPVVSLSRAEQNGIKIFLKQNIPYPHRYVRWTLDAARRNGQVELPENFQIDDMGSYVVIYEAKRRHTWKG